MKKIVFLFLILIGAVFVLLGCDNAVEEEEGTIYTKNDIYIHSYECGYCEEYEKIRYGTVIIETEEQLVFAEDCFSLEGSLEKLKENYSLEEYNYVLSYDETTSGIYDLEADRLMIKEDRIYFMMSDDSVYPDDGPQPDVMGGFFFEAAVPKEYFEGCNFVNAIYPDAGDITQYEEYGVYVAYDLADEALYNVYGDHQYIIRTEEEYSAFLAMSESVELYEGRCLEGTYINFDEEALLIIFFTRDETNISCNTENVQINGDTITLNYELVRNEKGYPTDTNTCIIKAYIPKELLTEEEYMGWVTPQ
ncbi:MAG: hypothetical protein IJZ42_10300 [Lachnospiraceae bacterium]|nr:hypothetical protein [Lachnospiraceae bacterium]